MRNVFLVDEKFSINDVLNYFRSEFSTLHERKVDLDDGLGCLYVLMFGGFERVYIHHPKTTKIDYNQYKWMVTSDTTSLKGLSEKLKGKLFKD